MFKTFLASLLVRFGVSSSVKKAVKEHLALRIKQAEDAVKEDIAFATSEFNKKLQKAVSTFADEKEAALIRQVNKVLSRLD